MTTPLQNSLEIFMTDVQRLQEENQQLKTENEKLKEFYIGLSAENHQLKEQLQQAQNEKSDKPAAIVGTRYCLKCGIESSYYFIDGFCNPCKECGVKLDDKKDCEHCKFKIEKPHIYFGKYGTLSCPDCNPERKPHKCPVCDGEGKVMHHTEESLRILYDMPLDYLEIQKRLYIKCLKCNGTGIVWEPK